MYCCVKVESAMAMRSLQPQVKAIQQRYAGDQVEFFVLPIMNSLCRLNVNVELCIFEVFALDFGI